MADWQADYPGAIVVPAANYGYATKNVPRGFVYHTPEEIADDDPQTPGYLAGTTRNASYTYFVSYLGFVFQLVPESEGAYANFVNGKPYPFWANPNINLNLQGISIAFEGIAATIHRTMVRGKAQWNAGVALVAHRAEALNISPDNWVRHADVSVARTDPGNLDLVAFTLDVRAKMQEGEMAKLIQEEGSGAVYITDGVWKWGIPSGTMMREMLSKGLVSGGVITVSRELFANLKLTHGQPAASGGITVDEAKEAAKEAAREGTG